MKIKNIAITTTLALFTLGLTGCHTTQKTTKTKTKEVSTTLSDQEKPLAEWVKCTTCSGKGTCSNCNGKGKINGLNCTTCSGTGKCNTCDGQGGYRSE